MSNEVNSDFKRILHSICHIAIILNINDKNDYIDFMNDFYLMDVNILHLQQVGENTSKLSEDFKLKHNEIDFRAIRSFRNISVHNYDGLDYEDVYSIIKEDIPDLKSKYESILINEFGKSKEFLEDYINYFLQSRKFKDVL